MAETVTAVADKKKSESKSDNKAKAKKYRFKLLRGQYISTVYEYVTDPDTQVKQRVAKHTTYQADPKKSVFPVIDTDINLEVYNGEHSGMKKFERIHGSATQTVSDPTKRLEGETLNAYNRRMEDLQKKINSDREQVILNLDKMTQDQLVELAKQEEIDISACKTVGDLRNTIRDSLFS